MTEKFLQGSPIGDVSSFIWKNNSWPQIDGWNRIEVLQKMQNEVNDGTKYTNLTVRECLDLYTDVYAQRTNMVMVTEEDPTANNVTVLQYRYLWARFSTIDAYFPCPDPTPELNGFVCFHADDRVDQPALMKKQGLPLKYCLSHTSSGEHCRIIYSSSIMIGEKRH